VIAKRLAAPSPPLENPTPWPPSRAGKAEVGAHHTVPLLPLRRGAEDRGKGLWPTLAAAALVALLALGLAACGGQPPSATTKPEEQRAGTAVAVAAAQRGDIAGALSFTGDVLARSAITVVPKVSGQIERLNVDVGSRVKAGDTLAQLDAVPLEAQVRQAEAALAGAQARLAGMEAGPRAEQVAQAQAGLDSARQRLTAMRNGPRAELVAQAEANLRAAEARLQQLKDGPTPEQRRAAQMNVEGAKVKAHAANVQKDGDCGPWKPEYLCQAAQANAIAAGYGIDAAQAQYDALVAPPTEQQLAQAQAAVDAAREQYRLAQSPYTEQDLAQAEDAVKVAEQQLKLAQSPFTSHDLDATRAQVAQAKAAFELARYQADQAKIIAPISGVVAERFLAQGALAAPTTPILALVTDEVEVSFSVDERQIGLLSAGMPVALTAAAFPGESFDGVITSLSPTVDPRTRTFTLKVAPGGDKLKPGMFAQLKVTAQQRQGVTLVPKEAIVHRNGKPVLFTLVDDRAKLVDVATGLTDEKRVEIVRGVAPGEQVIVSGNAELFDNDPVSVAAEKKGD